MSSFSNGDIDILSNVEMNEERFLKLLEKLIGESVNLQNNPAQGLIPREDLASNHVLEVLKPYSKEQGGVLDVQRISFVEGRGNVIVKYLGTNPKKICSFVGSHLDVVPANPEGWDRDPFKLQIEGDNLYGRGTTDCLGHVAMLTDFMATLAEKKPKLETTIVVIFIVNEENSAFPGIGVDQLALEGYMDELKNGPLFWIDSADTQPCIGTCGMLLWRIKATGKLFHSGLPHKGINSIEMAMDAVSYIQSKFFQEFPRHIKENDYNYATQSTMKPTQVNCTVGSLNQIPPECTIEGDIRLAPFYDVANVKSCIEKCVEEINKNPSLIESPQFHGPHSKYTLPDENRNGKIELTWISDGENGVACDITSVGHKALLKATEKIIGNVKPYSIGGSLPLIRELQEKGFDVQISGYGISSKYHADNESASLDSLKRATKIISTLDTFPIKNWPGEGMLGVTIRFDSFHECEDHVIHVLDVEPDSAAELAGLQPNDDYLLGTAENHSLTDENPLEGESTVTCLLIVNNSDSSNSNIIKETK